MLFHLVLNNATTRHLLPSTTKRKHSKRIGTLRIDHVHWSDWKGIIVRRLAAQHANRVLDSAAADVCIVASPPDGSCLDWASLCGPLKPLVVIDMVDADLVGSAGRYCSSLWHELCKSKSVLRVVGNPPAHGRRKALAACQHVSIPYPPHAASAQLASDSTGQQPRPIQIAFAAGVRGHMLAKSLGYESWRSELRGACQALQRDRGRRQRGSLCTYRYQSAGGQMAHDAIKLYSQATWCLMPPGDTLVRHGIVDALTVGCIPVLFHKGQRALWPWHWNASEASVLFDWQALQRAHKAPNATAALEALLHFPAAAVHILRRNLARVAAAFLYRGDADSLDATTHPADAIDTFLAALSVRVPAMASDRHQHALTVGR